MASWICPHQRLHCLSAGSARPCSVRSQVAAPRAWLAGRGLQMTARLPVLLREGSDCSATSLPLVQNGSKLVAMRHGKRVARLARPADQRRALVRNLTTEVLRHGKIRTTVVKAKAVRKFVDKMVTLAKRGDLHARRQALAFVFDKDLVKRMFEKAPSTYADRSSGYCRVLKESKLRRGDAAEMATLELL